MAVSYRPQSPGRLSDLDLGEHLSRQDGQDHTVQNPQERLDVQARLKSISCFHPRLVYLPRIQMTTCLVQAIAKVGPVGRADPSKETDRLRYLRLGEGTRGGEVESPLTLEIKDKGISVTDRITARQHRRMEVQRISFHQSRPVLRERRRLWPKSLRISVSTGTMMTKTRCQLTTGRLTIEEDREDLTTRQEGRYPVRHLSARRRIGDMRMTMMTIQSEHLERRVTARLLPTIPLCLHNRVHSHPICL